MFSYYSSINILIWLVLGILCILIYQDNRIKSADKHMYYLTYVIIALAALAEWAGLKLSGNTNVPAWVLRTVKCCDYILTPMAAFSLARQMKLRNRWNDVLIGVLAFNTAFQIISCFTNWMVVIDGQNHYTHGPLYMLYLSISIAVVILILIQLLIYSKAFRRQNRFSLYAIIGMILIGIAMQEIPGGMIRTEYLALTFGIALIYIHTTEFSRQSDEEQMQKQQILISTDALTGLYSRYAYSKTLNDYSRNLPTDLAAFSIDINGLKAVNDTLGHEAGDELISGAADCILRTFGEKGQCYRTGGDEFVVIVKMDREEADKTLEELKKQTQQWEGKTVKSLSLSAGYALAADHEGCSCEMLVKEADKNMYTEKKAFYQIQGHERRNRR